MNFDKQINRYNTNSLKYDFKQNFEKPDDVFPMWIADMDFQCAPQILSAMNKKIEHGIFGYSSINESYFNALHDWILKHNNVEVKREWLINTPGVIFAITLIIRNLTKENDNILVNTPIYNVFLETIEKNNRNVISSDLIYNNGYYEFDFNDFESKIINNNIHLFILCSPHNPIGRVWKKQELDQIINICKKHHVIIISDEIHSDFIWEGNHYSLLNYNNYIDNIIVCTSPSKTFNIAGLQVSNIFIPNSQLKIEIENELDKLAYHSPNIMGIVACEAGYKYGDVWFEELKTYLKHNIKFTENYIKENIPKIKVIHPEGTYLLWLDFNDLHLSDQEIELKLTNEAKLWLKSGYSFGKNGSGFQRLNIALPKENLYHALEQLKNTFC